MQNVRNYIENDQGLEIFTIPDFLTDEECDYLCESIEANNTRSSVAGGINSHSTYHNRRTSSTSVLNKSDKKIIQIEQKIYNELGISEIYSEPTQGQIYQVGQEFSHHNDYFDDTNYINHCLSSGQRTYTFMVYLNNVDEGGETDFPNINQKFTPQKRMAVVWKNSDGKGTENSASYHAGMPIKKGKKIIITKWFRENSFNSEEDHKLSVEYLKKNMEETKHKFSSPSDLPRLTPTGFKVVKVPEETWNIIKEAYEILKSTIREEHFPGKENIIKGNGVVSEIMSLDMFPSIRKIIHEQLKPIHQEWCGVNIDPTFVYGIRSYNKGATLAKHVDRIETHHISSIVIVDKDLECGCSVTKEAENDWALDIQDHEGNWHKVYAEIGDMILYESAICEHGREEPFLGSFFRNFYMHYKLSDYIYKQ
jgi:prolyl 4-hydroxylase